MGLGDPAGVLDAVSERRRPVRLRMADPPRPPRPGADRRRRLQPAPGRVFVRLRDLSIPTVRATPARPTTGPTCAICWPRTSSPPFGSCRSTTSITPSACFVTPARQSSPGRVRRLHHGHHNDAERLKFATPSASLRGLCEPWSHLGNHRARGGQPHQLVRLPRGHGRGLLFPDPASAAGADEEAARGHCLA